MKVSIKFCLTALLLFLFGMDMSAQSSTYERTPGYWTFGLNGGAAYHTFDLPQNFEGWGAGLTLAKNLYYRPGSTFAFDLRGRALYSESYGLGHQRNYDLRNNEALNGTFGLDYTKAGSGDGFVFNNSKTHLGELGLEGVLHFNRLRERTNLDLSLFGGIGIGWYKARLDQTDDDDNMYTAAYAGIDTTASRSAIRRQLKYDILDGYYETDGAGMNPWGSLGIMPGAGIELGYQLTPKFSIGVGHKVTFTKTDLFDGVVNDNPNVGITDNDWHHYTNLNLRWIIDPAKEKMKKPEIDIINPQSKLYKTYQPNGFVRATIKHVPNAIDIDLMVNGSPTPFEYNNGVLKSNFKLLEGPNKVTITAFNTAGTDTETVTISYVNRTRDDNPVIKNENPVIKNDPVIVEDPVVSEEPRTRIPYPSVKITRPYRTSETVENDQYRVKARIEHVEDADDIYFTVNGRSISNFSFWGDNFESEIYLREGNNRIKIEARNDRGKRSDQATLRLEVYQPLVRPTVEITRPSRDPYTTEKNSERIEALIGPIDNKCNIIFKVNGRSVSRFDYRGDRFSGNADLREGRNEIEVIAANDAGTSSDRTIIIYEKAYQVALPEVDITTPKRNNTTTEKNRVEIKANTENVNSRSDIRFLVNGRTESDFDFDKRREKIRGFALLKEGRNNVTIEVRNADGRDQSSVTIIYKVPKVMMAKPKVSFTKPSGNTTTDKNKYRVTARVEHVTKKNNIDFKVNGRSVRFTFSASRKLLEANVGLKEGTNRLIITARNESGTATDQVNIAYNKKADKPAGGISKGDKGGVIGKGKPGKINKPSFSKPVVSSFTMSQPVVNPLKPDVANTRITAIMKNVKSKSEITLTLDGNKITDYELNTRTGRLTVIKQITRGTHYAIIKVKTKGGQTEKRTEVRF